MKTNFLNKLKQGLFLLIAVLGTFIGYSQSLQTTTIGGTKALDTVSFFDVGEKQVLPTNLPNLMLETQCVFTFVNDIGGKGSSNDTGPIATPGFPIIEIGGRTTGGDLTDLDKGKNSTAEVAYSEIGGKNTPGDVEPFGDIGGRGDLGTGFIFGTAGSSPGGIGLFEDGNQSKLSKIEMYGCVLRPLYLDE